MVEVSLAWMQHDIKWHIVAMMIFFLFVLVFMLVKIKRRIRVLLKRITKIEEEERQEKEREARKEKIHAGAAEMAELYRTDPDLKELNEFVGDYRDHDSV
jgi:predicted Holliday junction resolvase-like endonuclease